MHRLKMSLLACVIVTTVTMLQLTVGGAKASPLTCGSWSVVSSPNPGNTANYLNAVAAQSARNVWAVGYYNATNHPSLTLIEQWNGVYWTSWAAANPGAQGNFLFGVTAPSASDIWAVGYDDNSSGVAQTLTENWNGSKWSLVPSPNVGSKGNLLLSMAANSTSDIWAVGEYYNSSNVLQTLTEHWNGSSWSVVSSPNVGLNNNALYSVTAISASDIWAVGWYYNGSVNQTLTEHWNGSSWSVVHSPNRGSLGNVLYSITAVSSGYAWAVGSYYNGSANQTLIEFWNGSFWGVVGSPNAGSDSLSGVTAQSPTNAWAVGYYYNGSANQTLTEHWNGSTWNIVSSANVGSGYNALDGVAQVPGSSDVWAVGYYVISNSSQTLTELYC